MNRPLGTACTRRAPAFPPVALLLPLTISAVLTFASGATAATVTVPVDGQAVVNPGSPQNSWLLNTGSTLTVRPGAITDYIRAVGSNVTVSVDGATVQGSHASGLISLNGGSLAVTASNVRNDTGIGVLLTGATNATVAASNVTGGIGLDARIGTSVRIANSLITGTSTAGIDGRGELEITDGSTVIGASHGVRAILDVSGSTPDIIIDRSTVSGTTGAAIQVLSLGPAAPGQEASFVVKNGANLTGANGNLFEFAFAGPGAEARARLTVESSTQNGNVIGGGVGSEIHLVLQDRGRINGRFTDVTTASIDSDGAWLLTGDSNVGQLTLGATGTVALGDGSAFNTLTVDSFTGNGGTLGFNTALGDDSSATDKLIITGDTNGQANVRVHNAGGAGAQTSKGIELIRIGGASNAQFDLQGRAVGGQYEYFLFKDATDGGWYLRSQLATAPDPCLADPTLPQCRPIVDPVDPVDPIIPIPVLRPEAGAYLANQFALDQLLRHQWRDRQGGSRADDGVRGWARVDGTQSKLSAVDDQLDLRVDRSRLQLGADLGVFDDGHGRVGVMGTVAQSSATSRSLLTGYSAKGKVEGGALGVYGSWSSDALYVDASVQRGQFRNRVRGEGLAEERYDSDIWQSSLEAGYRFGVGQIGSTALSLQPELQLVYTDATTDRHTEATGTVVRSLGDSGLSGRVGLRLQGEGRSAAGASVSPYVVANWYRDGASNGMAFDDEALKASVPRNRYELNAGARVNFRSGLSAWGGLGVMRGDHGYREATANVSAAYTW